MTHAAVPVAQVPAAPHEAALFIGAAAAVLLCSVLLMLVRRGLPLLARLPCHLVLFAAATVLLQRHLGGVIGPRFDRGDGVLRLAEQLLACFWWIEASQGAVAATRLLIVLEDRPRETRIVSDLLAAAIRIGAALAIVAFVFAVPVRGLLATSGVIAIVLGLALQSTLSDVFSGIAVGLERPFKAGDVISLDGDLEGRVEQVNWRSTRILLDGETLAVVPNSTVAKTRVLNRSAPTPQRGDHIEIAIHPAVPPERALAVLRVAVQGVRHVLAHPPPDVSCRSIAGDATRFKVTFAVDRGPHLATARTELLARLHRHLTFAGIPLAVPGVAPAAAELGRPPGIADLLARSDLFGPVEAAHRAQLAALFTLDWIKRGDTLFRQGETPVALFVIASGVVRIDLDPVDHEDRPPLHVLAPGETIGAYGLISGKSYVATASAMTDLEVHRLERDALFKALDEYPDLGEGLEAIAARASALMTHDADMSADTSMDRPDALLGRLRLFVRRIRGLDEARV